VGGVGVWPAAKQKPKLKFSSLSLRVARWLFFRPFLTKMAIFKSDFLSKIIFGYTRFCGYFMAIFQNTFLHKFLKAIWLFSGYFWTIFSNFSSVLYNKSKVYMNIFH